MEKILYKAFTQKFSGLVNCLKNQIMIEGNGNFIQTTSIWDTGASGTCISEEIAKHLKLILTGYASINTPAGLKVVKTYLVNIYLPNKVEIVDVPVCDSSIGN